ncbi:MAG: hypothetical protein H6721_22395 [Sandaracinus sp.]|nr:hypothetical protein [Myxococcales bacterium]MCB9610917.1 hypothetical protein [Sandaracinus sp.]MCB9619488.1 hypothetical protein [Sandaracinus sp.]MCB9634886.1 hypothetical protein [Sandaracinus sp.]
MTRLLQAAFAISMMLVAARSAEAQRPTPGEVVVVLAKEAPGTIAPELAELTALRRPPFDSFRSMEVLERRGLSLRVGTPAEVVLPNGRKLRIELQRIGPDGRFRVKVSIQREGEQDYLPLLQVVASPGDPFFVAGQSHQGGTLVIGIRLGDAA